MMLTKSQNLFAKGGTPKFKGHVTPNEDEYQNSVLLKFRYCLGVS